MLIKKCFGSGHLVFSPDDEQDLTQDYMGSQVNLTILLVVLQAWSPAVANGIVLLVQENSRLVFADEDSMNTLTWQFWMQVAQYLSIYPVLYLNMSFHWLLKYIQFIFLLLNMIFIPILSVIFWAFAYN